MHLNKSTVNWVRKWAYREILNIQLNLEKRYSGTVSATQGLQIYTQYYSVKFSLSPA
jgi:hypothetical protein